MTLLAITAPVEARRLALVIGNDSYQHAALGNARADTKVVAEALKATNFKVTLKQDVTLQGMKEALRAFKNEVAGGDEVIFYCAAHGVQLEGNNYMIPVDTAGDSADQLKDDSVSLQRVLDAASSSPASKAQLSGDGVSDIRRSAPAAIVAFTIDRACPCTYPMSILSRLRSTVNRSRTPAIETSAPARRCGFEPWVNDSACSFSTIRLTPQPPGPIR